MNAEELTKFPAMQGLNRSSLQSRKRSSSQLTHKDASQERWERSRRSFQQLRHKPRRFFRRLQSGPETAQKEPNTRWYEKVAQLAQGDSKQEKIGRNTRWYEEVTQHTRRELEQGALDWNTRMVSGG